jgi:hypothetical protein
MQEMVAAGKQFDKNMKLFGDYAPMRLRARSSVASSVT